MRPLQYLTHTQYYDPDYTNIRTLHANITVDAGFFSMMLQLLIFFVYVENARYCYLLLFKSDRCRKRLCGNKLRTAEQVC